MSILGVINRVIMIGVILTLMVIACFIVDNSDDNNYKY